MPYPQGPYSRHASLPVPPRPKLSAARKIDFVNRRYVVDATTGGFEHMPPIPQVVVILSFRVSLGEFNTLPERNKYAQGITTVLQPLITADPPLIEDLEVIVETGGPSGITTTVKFKDVTDQRNPVEIQLP